MFAVNLFTCCFGDDLLCDWRRNKSLTTLLDEIVKKLANRNALIILKCQRLFTFIFVAVVFLM